MSNIESYENKFKDAVNMYHCVIGIDPVQIFKIFIQKIITL